MSWNYRRAAKARRIATIRAHGASGSSKFCEKVHGTEFLDRVKSILDNAIRLRATTDMDIVKNWYLVHTKPRKETVAEENLERQGYEVYLPLINQQRRRYERWVQIIQPLFPRYLFIRLRPGYDNMEPVRYTSGVQNFVRFTEEPVIVPGVVVDSIKRTTDTRTGLHTPKRLAFQTGDTVMIEKGPLANLQAIVWGESGEERVMILIKILGRETAVTVSRNLLDLA